MQPPAEKYRTNLLPMALLMIGACACAGTAAFVLVAAINHSPVEWGVLLGLIAAMIPAGFVFGALAVAFYPVYVSPAGLRSCGVLGLYDEAAWGEIVSADRVRVLGLPYLSVRTAAGRSVRLPLFLSEWGRFKESVTAQAGAESPLSKALGEVR